MNNSITALTQEMMHGGKPEHGFITRRGGCYARLRR